MRLVAMAEPGALSFGKQPCAALSDCLGFGVAVVTFQHPQCFPISNCLQQWQLPAVLLAEPVGFFHQTTVVQLCGAPCDPLAQIRWIETKLQHVAMWGASSLLARERQAGAIEHFQGPLRSYAISGMNTS